MFPVAGFVFWSAAQGYKWQGNVGRVRRKPPPDKTTPQVARIRRNAPLSGKSQDATASPSSRLFCRFDGWVKYCLSSQRRQVSSPPQQQPVSSGVNPLRCAASLQRSPVAKGNAVGIADRAGNGKPRLQRRRGVLGRFLRIHIQLAVRETVAHAGKGVRDKAQARQPLSSLLQWFGMSPYMASRKKG